MVKIQCKWEWKEKTRTFLLRLRFIPLRPSPNFRWGVKTERGTIVKGKIGMKFSDGRSWEVPIIDWAPSWLEFGQIGELLRFTDILNSLKIDRKLYFKDQIGEEWINSEDITQKSWWELVMKYYG
jgi:hypothetical protein